MPGNSLPKQDASVIRTNKLDTATISDALDRLGIAGQCLNIKPRDPRFRLTGRAFTMLYRADGSGVVFISAENIERVLQTAEEIFAREAAMAKALYEGKPITEVMGANYEHMLRN